MELLLNLLWLSISLLLVVLWTRAARLGHTKHTWTTFVALALLLVLLFPVISMTDDLVAMAAPLEDDHPVRRVHMPLLHLDNSSAVQFDVIALLAWLISGMAFLAARLSRLTLPSLVKTAEAGFTLALAVRPPPAQRTA